MNPCDGQADGVVVSKGTSGECMYTDPCALTGLQTRTDRVCQAGMLTDTAVESAEGCDRTVAETNGASCGDGLVCDASLCTSLCGDGLVRLDETCDDGNLEDDDGCSATCDVEPFWSCDEEEPSRCDGISWEMAMSEGLRRAMMSQRRATPR